MDEKPLPSIGTRSSRCTMVRSGQRSMRPAIRSNAAGAALRTRSRPVSESTTPKP